jgi:hypothetical protein
MDALEEAYQVIFDDSPPVHLSRGTLAEFAVEGLGPIHSKTLIQRCRETIANDPQIPPETKDWAKHTFAECLAEERS